MSCLTPHCLSAQLGETSCPFRQSQSQHGTWLATTSEWTELQYGWPEGTVSTTVTVGGDTLSTHLIEGDVTTYNNDVLSYWSEAFEVVDRYELSRYITPYGINLTLGPDGWAWVFDVTDYAPLLKDSVELECGNWQELLDLKFAFIEGTPPRDVQNVTALLERHSLPEQLGRNDLAKDVCSRGW